MRRILFLVGFVLFLSGCSSGSFIGRRVENFTAYYNKFYNARKALNAGLKALENQNQPVRRDIYIPVFSNPSPAANTTEFDRAVTKSADVLRQNPDSKWVDDALLLIGKAYFYQQNYVGAEQKFQEVIEVSPALGDEARFWLARTLIASGNYDRANEHLIASLNREDLRRHWEAMLRLALGELYVKREQWKEAAEQLTQGLEHNRDNEIGARAQFLLGQVYETMGSYEEAVEAFRSVRRFHPLYELSYAAQYNAVRVEGLYLDSQRALQALRRMERDDKNFSNRAELQFLRGQIYQAQGYSDDAYYVYNTILYDSDANISNLRGQIHYALGELYRDAYEDYILASAHFDTASTTLGNVGARGRNAAGNEEEHYTTAAITDARQVAEVFKSFATVRDNIATMDSLLYVGSLDEEAFEEFVNQLRLQRAREIEEERREQARRAAEQGFQNTDLVDRNRSTDQSVPQADEASGFLFHRNRMLAEENWRRFINVWGERPHVPNWRRQEAVTTIVESRRREGKVDSTGGDEMLEMPDMSLPIVDISAIPRDSISQEKMRADRAMARYELGNVLFLSMNLPDSAATWYRLVVEEDTDQPVAQRAYYALAEVHRTLGDTLAARRLYEHILEAYPESDYIGQVRERLGLAPVKVEVADSLALAEAAYNQAYRLWTNGAYAQALDDMARVAAKYHTTEIAPRALLACGAIYLQWAKRDGLDLYANLPFSLPDSVLSRAGLVPVAAAPDSAAVLDSTAIAGGSPLVPDSTGMASNSMAAADSFSTVEGIPSVPDSSQVAAADSLLAYSDLDGFPEDTSQATADSIMDSSYAAVDSLHTVIDGVSDSVSTIIDTTFAGTDSLLADTVSSLDPANESEPEKPGITIEALFSALSNSYAQTPYAERAQMMWNVLAQQRAATEMPADSASTAEVPADSASTAEIPPDSASTVEIPEEGLIKDSILTEIDADSTVQPIELLEEDFQDSEVDAQAPDVVPEQAVEVDSTGSAAPDSSMIKDPPFKQGPVSGENLPDSQKTEQVLQEDWRRRPDLR